MWLTHHASEGLEITDIEPATGSFHENFIEKRLDRFPLSLLHVKTCEVGKASSDHVPCGDGFFGVQIGRRRSERINAKGQALASKRRPYPNFATVEQLLGSGDNPVLFLELAHIDAEGQPSEVTLRVDDEGRNASERRFFDERLGHDGFSRPG